MPPASVSGRARRVGACWMGCSWHQGPYRDQNIRQNQRALGERANAAMQRVRL